VVLRVAARRSNSASGCGTLIGVLLLIGLAIMIIKWALITAAILAVPFGIWWVLDRSKRRKQAQEVQAR
jgi:Flp pilus assembly protein TadB